MTIVATTNSTAEENLSQPNDYWPDLSPYLTPQGWNYATVYVETATVFDITDQGDINLPVLRFVQTTREIADALREISANATSILPSTIQVDSVVNSLFNSSVDASSDESEQSDFTRDVAELIRQYDTSALDSISDYFYKEKVEPELAWIALQEIGRIDDAVTHNHRMWILIEGLRAKSHWYRDGSALGLYNLTDPGAIPYLKNAENVEVYEELKRTYGKIVNHMEQK